MKIDEPSPDELEYAARRYAAPRLTILPLSSGNIAVGRGFNPPDLLFIAESADELIYFLRAEAAESLAAAAAEAERRASAGRMIQDFTLDLSDIGL